MLNLYMSVIEVSGLPDTASFWMATDPYVKVTCGGRSEQTSIKKRAGGRAIYHEALVMPLETTDIQIEIFDKQTFGRDGLLADGLITVKQRDGYSFLGPIPLNDCSNHGMSPQITLAISLHC